MTLPAVHQFDSPAMVRGGDPTDGGHCTFERCWTYAWQLFVRHWGFLTVFALCYLAAMIVSGFIPIVGSLAMVYAGPVLMGSAGFAVITAERKREKAQLAKLFDLFLSSRSLEVVLIGLLILVMAIIPIILVVIGGIVLLNVANSAGGQLDWAGWVSGSLLVLMGILLSTIIQIRFGLAYLICVDRPSYAGFDVMGSLKESWLLTEGHTIRLLALWLVMYVVMLASMLPLCLGYLLVVMQISMATLVAVYFYLLGPDSRGGPFANLDICPWCSYDLSATAGHLCPECGKVHPARMANESGQAALY